MNYTQLAAQVPGILMAENSELTDATNFQTIVNQAHDEVVNLLDHEAFQSTISNVAITAAATIDLTVYTPPVAEIRAVRIRVSAGSTFPTYDLKKRALETLSALYPTSAAGSPRFYAEYEPLKARVFPPPATTVYAEIDVNREPAVVTAASPTNLFTTSFPVVFDNAVLRRAAVFMKDWEAVDRYQAELTAAVAAANAEIGRHRRDETAERPRRTENVQGT